MSRPPFGPPATDSLAATPDEPTIKLARQFHLEWCADCADWRPLGHEDAEKRQNAGALVQRFEEETSGI